MIKILLTLKNNDKLKKNVHSWIDVQTAISDILYTECHQELKRITIKELKNEI